MFVTSPKPHRRGLVSCFVAALKLHLSLFFKQFEDPLTFQVNLDLLWLNQGWLIVLCQSQAIVAVPLIFIRDMLWGLKLSIIKVKSSPPDETHSFHLPSILGSSSLASGYVRGMTVFWCMFPERTGEAMQKVKVKLSTSITDCSNHSIFKRQRWVLSNIVAAGERETTLRSPEFCRSPVQLWNSSLLRDPVM